MRAAASLSLVLVLAACPSRELGELEARSEAARPPAPAPVEPSPPTADGPPPLVEQLDLVPLGADYLVIRDLRPLLDEARTLERVLAGPLARALPGLAAMAELDAETSERAGVTLAETRSTLALVLAGLEGSGIALDQGLVVSELDGAPLLAFAAADAAQLTTLAGVLELDLAAHCRPIDARPSWWACSSSAAIDRYRPTRAGAQRRATLTEQLPGVDLDAINLAASLGADAAGPALSVVLRSDADGLSLTMPLPSDEGAALLAKGPAPALAQLAPATSFTWLRVDPAGLPEALGEVPLPRELIGGELLLGLTRAPEAMLVRVATADAVLLGVVIGELAATLPPTTTLAGLELALEGTSLELGGPPTPALALAARGDTAARLEQALGLPARGRLWAANGYATLAWGHVDALPQALAAAQTREPSDELLATLPPALAGALQAGEVAALMHFALDAWQAPLREAELAGLLVESPALTGEALGQAFVALAPWSSASVWVARPRGAAAWLLHVDLVPFAAPDPAISPEELAASEAVLARVLAGEHAAAAYRELLARWPSSPHAARWQARLGEAPPSHAAIGLLQAGLAALVVTPLLDAARRRSQAGEASESTAAILAAAVALREREGSCASLLGKAGPTPALALDCSGRCRPGDAGYPSDAWTSEPRWAALGWAPAQGHRFHYELEAALADASCTIDVRAYGDLDDDGVFSTYARSTTIAADGSQRVSGLNIESEGE